MDEMHQTKEIEYSCEHGKFGGLCYLCKDAQIAALEAQLASVKREGIIEGEDAFAAWLVRKDGEIVYSEGGNESAKEALRRYRMGRGW
jgi:hypothetical protein